MPYEKPPFSSRVCFKTGIVLEISLKKSMHKEKARGQAGAWQVVLTLLLPFSVEMDSR
ncbi:hypothetical protein [Ligaoa zhengdingensis]|uniref:hypothetical protein n=1 Tax=Ligaoa zhengdingensis TaxID=2763658 RepID=UPI0031BAC10B